MAAHQIMAWRGTTPRATSTVATASPSGMLCSPIASVTSTPCCSNQVIQTHIYSGSQPTACGVFYCTRHIGASRCLLCAVIEEKEQLPSFRTWAEPRCPAEGDANAGAIAQLL